MVACDEGFGSSPWRVTAVGLGGALFVVSAAVALASPVRSRLWSDPPERPRAVVLSWQATSGRLVADRLSGLGSPPGDASPRSHRCRHEHAADEQPTRLHRQSRDREDDEHHGSCKGDDEFRRLCSAAPRSVRSHAATLHPGSHRAVPADQIGRRWRRVRSRRMAACFQMNTPVMTTAGMTTTCRKSRRGSANVGGA